MFFSFSYIPYIAIIGDIKNSKQITDRKKIQKSLNQVLDQLNKKYLSDISAKFTITLGDEFQGLLCKGENTFNIVETIQREMYPIELRFGIGVGEITTDINMEMAIGADGPGYYNARKAIETLKYNEQRKQTPTEDVRIIIEGDQNSISPMLNTIFSLTAVIRKDWTKRQREIIWAYDNLNSSQSECAKRLGISQSSVQRSLNKGNYYSYKNATDTINNILKEIGESRV